MSHTEYTFTRVVVKNGEIVSREAKTLSSEDLYQRTSHIGRTAFLELLNKWNRTGLLGIPNGGPTYVYIAS